jgi:ComF family protein
VGERGAHRDSERGLGLLPPEGGSHRWLDAALRLALAPCCAACRQPLDSPSGGPVCPTCWLRITPLPALRAYAYDGALRDIIHAFKYEGRRSLARPLAALIRAVAADRLRGADCAVPVPLHPWRRLQRGFNQASDLADELGLPVVHALWRVRWTRQQMGLARDARRGNVRGSMRVPPWRREDIGGRVVVLVDDVRTTGATLEACATVLQQAGAREVRPVTVAVVPGRV